MSAITGLCAFSPSRGGNWLVACWNNRLGTYDGSSAIVYLVSGGLDTSGYCRMVQANDAVYGCDAAGVVFKFNGSVLSKPNIQTSAGTPIANVTDVAWFLNRLWFTTGDQIHFTNAFDPSAPGAIETIDLPSIRVRQGGGDRIVRLLPFRNSTFIVFKQGYGGSGSIHLLDVSATSPEFWRLDPVFHDLNIIAPHAIVRAGNDLDSDILYVTREGVRSLRFTALDKVTQPTIPFSENIKDYLFSLSYNNLNRSHAVIFEDEYLWFVPVTDNPELVFAYNLKVPKDTPLQGWTVMDTMHASSAASIAFGTGKPALYYGGNDGYIYRAFAARGTSSTYKEVSRRITHDLPEQDKNPRKLLINFDRGSSGQVNVRLRYQDGSEYLITTITLEGGGVLLPALLPVFLREGTIRTEPMDLIYDATGARLPRYKDVRIDIRSTGNPEILGWRLISLPEKLRFKEISDIQRSDNAAANVTLESVAAEAVNMD